MNNYSLYPSFWLVLFTLFLTRNVSAQTNKMDTVSIYGTKNNLTIQSAVPVQILTSNELKGLNSLSVADATRFLSGVQLKDYGGVGGLKTINVRSMGSSHTQVLLDGIAVGNMQNGQVDLGKYSLENIEQISLYNGDRQALLQPAKSFASASYMYLQSKTPQFKEGKDYNLTAGLKHGSFDLINPSLLVERKINENLNATISTEYTQASGKYKFRLQDPNYDTVAYRENADIKAFRAESIINGKWLSGDWRSHVYIYSSDRGLPDAIIANRLKPTSPEKGQRQKDRNIFFQSSYRKELNRYSFLVNAKYANDYTYYLNPNIIKIEGPLENNFRQQEIFLSFANQYKVTRQWGLSLSADWQWNKLNANLDDFAYPTRYTTLLALASQYKVDRVTFQSSLLATLVQDHAKHDAGAGVKRRLSPTFSISWQPFTYQDFRIRAFYKNIFRMPTFNDLYYTDIGNTSLRPENANQFNVGATYGKSLAKALKYFSIQADVYYNTINDKIIASPANNQFRWIMYNLDRVETKGVDVLAKVVYQPFKKANITMGLNYTFEEALDMTENQENHQAFNRGQQIPYIPKHSGSLIVQMDYRSFRLNYSFLYTGERYSQAANRADNYLQPWYTHDISIGKEDLTFTGKVKLNLMLEMNNFLNQPYEVVKNFPMPGRNFRIRISFKY
ncbi:MULTISPECIES: TonB-dependent receptor plug domain-containing protein [Olivibacter]|uniref:TonB-dependent receptor plug domain-containing protein n=1 Tax=Olivibacter oleidegradans TaxID=760123 RepID=A0ABV6HKD5_9SPHI|nr:MULTISPECIES: TonB-dependent receptor [Olivibacter]MCL4641342.1 TonB-dependent receptor [Olivibacter sp. UJ_SKK_5.1]MDM8175390.1 TonB-dependent receptor [Olivibacter sp. 47]MDX3914004.1 TonB-dependent receptor [Pseudosphingobacterium sp.]QEL02151.1 TonB-dependent receptor [Olivibacter sp. LS-1]